MWVKTRLTHGATIVSALRACPSIGSGPKGRNDGSHGREPVEVNIEKKRGLKGRHKDLANSVTRNGFHLSCLRRVKNSPRTRIPCILGISFEPGARRTP